MHRGLPVRAATTSGYSAIEVLFAAGLVVTLGAIAVPNLLMTLDDYRAAAAARYVSARLQRARMEAVMRSRVVAVRFKRLSTGQYTFTVFVDGNRTGVLTPDIARGVDIGLAPPESLRDTFAGIEFGALPGTPGTESRSPPPGEDPVRLGSSNSVSFTPAGTATSGSLYVRGRRAQYVIRVFGETGKVRVLRFDAATKQWKPL
jgi:type II secretory pathway pseudopilin PulG